MPSYQQWFTRVFGPSGLTGENVTKAIATFERTVVSGQAPFDLWVEGDENAISASAKRGFDLFNGKAACADCHMLVGTSLIMHFTILAYLVKTKV